MTRAAFDAAVTRASASMEKSPGSRHTATHSVSHILAKLAYSAKSGGQVTSGRPEPQKVKSRLKSSSSPPLPTQTFRDVTPCQEARASRSALAMGSG